MKSSHYIRDVIAPAITRLFVWSLLFGIIYLLRSFSLLIFLTFVFAYIQTHAVDHLATKIKGRTSRVLLVSATLLAILIAIGTFLAPRVREQAELFASHYPKYLKSIDLSIVDLSNNYPLLDRISSGMTQLKENPGSWNLHISPTARTIQEVFGLEGNHEGTSNIKEIFIALTNIGGKLLATGSAFLLSLLFSFLIVLDLPRLTASVRSLKDTSIGFIYREVAEDLKQFANTLGRALEAQLFIGLLNTFLTAIGLYVLGLHENIAFLSVIVFLCSFVPVAGVFVSSIPICLLALQESGVSHMLLAIGLIVFIHMIETYILNPKIYGHHLHMNPVLVLSILTIGGKLFHVWGLILGVPICTYFFGYYIRRNRVNSLSDNLTET